MKKIIFVILTVVLIWGGFVGWRKYQDKKQAVNPNKESTQQVAIPNNDAGSSCQDGQKTITYQECVDGVNKTDIANASDMYLKFVGLRLEDDPSKFDLVNSIDLMKLYYSCKILSTKDEKVLAEAKKYTQYLKNGGQVETAIDYANSNFDDMFAGKLSTPYFGLGENVALGDSNKICPDELPIICKQTFTVSKNDDNGYCDSLCAKLSDYAEDPTAAQKNILDKSTWRSSPNAYRSQSAFAYRVGGKDLALKLCNGSDLEDAQRSECLRLVYAWDEKNVSCDDVQAKIAKIACSLDKQKGLCQ